jgi:hypothetical protein
MRMEQILSFDKKCRFQSAVEVEDIFCHIGHVENPTVESSDLITTDQKGI